LKTSVRTIPPPKHRTRPTIEVEQREHDRNTLTTQHDYFGGLN